MPVSQQRYRINECFYSLQGEGVRAGSPNVFLRFAGCNLSCTKATHGFDCDTDFTCNDKLTAADIVDRIVAQDRSRCRWVVLTGGEPALQLDNALVQQLNRAGYRLAIETNGTHPLPDGIDWICVSPKQPGPPLAISRAHEVKYVVRAGQPLPQPAIEAEHYLLSPAFETEAGNPGLAHSPRFPPEDNLRWCIELCLEHPPWRLSLQQHKLWGLR